jgi:hypothetical protein
MITSRLSPHGCCCCWIIINYHYKLCCWTVIIIRNFYCTAQRGVQAAYNLFLLLINKCFLITVAF